MECEINYRELFSKRLSLLLKYNGLTSAGLAKNINVSKSLVTKYTSGKSSPSFENLIKIANHFNVSMDYLSGRSSLEDTKGTGRTNDNKIPEERFLISIDNANINLK
ncbi:helix-turn-helix domain-containing protein [Pontibacillus litoralis]|uniref:HTH cro/C1-type domain-containing protein n=1 Tax=Pontibacillus litoralis JSM 072002 TaxID=1385512 RepID=A0A0A5HNH8_9BACI|nr:helix-turn-helix transcriptional regulator [Pontibacillus litoralis]KGX85197.1 hypothetical protein N784_09885 [Pontibacillus litoralis JSM 072002]